MLEPIKKIVEYVQAKVNFTVSEATNTNTVYLITNHFQIRLSDHLSKKTKSDIQVITFNLSPGYLVSIFRQPFFYKDYKEIGDLLVNYYFINNEHNSTNIELNDLKARLINLEAELNRANSKIAELNNQLTVKDNELTTIKNKKSSWLSELKDGQNRASEYKRKIYLLNEENKRLTNDCQEAAELLGKVLNPEIRESLRSKEDKKYYLDNFPLDVRDFIKELILEYY